MTYSVRPRSSERVKQLVGSKVMNHKVDYEQSLFFLIGQFVSNTTKMLSNIFSTRSSERFGDKHRASDLLTRAKQRIFPQSKKLLVVRSAHRNFDQQLYG